MREETCLCYSGVTARPGPAAVHTPALCRLRHCSDPAGHPYLRVGWRRHSICCETALTVITVVLREAGISKGANF